MVRSSSGPKSRNAMPPKEGAPPAAAGAGGPAAPAPAVGPVMDNPMAKKKRMVHTLFGPHLCIQANLKGPLYFFGEYDEGNCCGAGFCTVSNRHHPFHPLCPCNTLHLVFIILFRLCRFRYCSTYRPVRDVFRGCGKAIHGHKRHCLGTHMTDSFVMGYCGVCGGCQDVEMIYRLRVMLMQMV